MPFIEARRSWERRFARAILFADLTAILLALGGTQLLWWDTYWSGAITFDGVFGTFVVGYPVVTLLLVVAWWAPLCAARARHPRVLADGWAPYRRVIGASAGVFGTFAVCSYLLKLEIGRSFLLTALPLGIVLLIAIRWVARRSLRKRRRDSRLVYRTLLVGDRDSVVHVAQRVRRGGWAGHQVVGVVTPGIVDDEELAGAPVLVGRASVLDAAVEVGADTVIMAGSDELTPAVLRRLGWDLSERGVKLILAPTLTGVAGTRLHLQPVAGLPLLHVDFPELSGVKAIAKRTFDIIASAGILLALSPIMLVVALAVKLSGPGTVLYRQERIGLRGEPFSILKFRSMSAGADSGAALAAQQNAGELLTKDEHNPLVTPVGRILRKYSLDELPQLLNVLGGSMSLVGPRPHRDWEVERYDMLAQRRLLVKPGMSGLWQVSGRSSLSWDDSVDLDLYYVENWSAAGDLKILAQTFKAVIAPGADAR
ncbi:sugar transferase [Plantibacter flavus]|uniref:sugar transferase n=1 Tax=Plantibacter flavus TaxID=150123 RepID=UPI003F1525FF